MKTRGDDVPEPYNLGRSCQGSIAILGLIATLLTAIVRKAGR